jgi:osmotically-inducible protein OsmY
VEGEKEEKPMKNRFPIKLMLASALLLAGTAMATTPNAGSPSDDATIAAKVVHEIRMYPRYTVWDNVTVRVHEGDVEIAGQVSQPFKKDDMGRLAQRVAGVRSVTNEIKVLPTSFFDDRLRLQVARAIFRDPVLSRYAIQPIPPIHIIVDNGHVTLEGVVRNRMDKEVAGIRASQSGLSFGQVTNNLRVENTSTRG